MIYVTTGAFCSIIAERFSAETKIISSDLEIEEPGLVVFSGGSDVSPDFYNEPNRHSYFQLKRDIEEERIFRLAISRNMPIFGICRGLQLVNVLLGGTLYQDLHEDVNAEHESSHILHYSDSIFNLRTEYKVVNSMHHQGIKGLGNGLRTIATYKGLPEVVVGMDSKILLVQFHPECLSNNYIFDLAKTM